MAYSEELERRIDAIAGHAGFVKKKMFGGLGYLLQGDPSRNDPCWSGPKPPARRSVVQGAGSFSTCRR